ncbi:unnamed protein product [Dicrocoelium dendriticum]|nr:unnamed protein product [Dicrocoelium dendriticum]
MRTNNFDSLESFVKQILATDDPTKREQLDRACRQLSRHQIKLIGRLSTPFSVKHPTKQRKQLSSSSLPPPNLQSVLASLHLISRCTPSLFIEHLDFLLDLLHKAPTTPVLSSATSVSSGTPRNEVSSGMDVQCLFHLINTTEVLLQSVAEDIDNKGPHATDSFLDRLIHIKLPELQRDLIRLIQRQGRVVVDSSFSCLATLTNRVLKEHTQVAACFGQFYGLLINLSFELQRALSTKVTNSTALSSRTRPSVLRALYTVGLMCKHFRLEDLTGDCDRVSTSAPVLDEVVDTLMLFAEYAAAPVVIQPSASGDTGGETVLPAAMNDPDLCRKAVMGLGFLVSRHDQLLCTKRLSTFFSRFLVAARPGSSKPTAFHEVQYIILDNLMHYFLDMEREMVENSQLWASIHKSESLKELSDCRSGHGSAVAQEYLPLILRHCVLTSSANVRTATLGLISIILRQGLVHPVQTVSALICFQTDPDAGNRMRASHLLLESERKVPGFVAMRAPAGVYMSYHLHLLLHLSALDMNHSPLRIPIIRGFAPENTLSTGPVSPGNNAQPTALNHAVYTILRSNRQSRRSFISSLLSSFVSDQKTTESSDFESVLSGLLSSNVPHDPLGRLIFLSDQLAHFPYATQDEVLYVAFTVERLVSDCGPALLRIVQHALLSSLCNSEPPNPVDEEEEKGRILRAETELHNLLDSVESKLAASCKATDAEDVATSFDWDEGGRLQKLFELSQPSSLRQKSFKSVLRTGPVCFLLLAIREHLRDVYGVTDSKLKDYSPTDSVKQWDKPVQPAKRSQAISQVLQLPLLVLQCMKTPGWLDGSVVPPAKVILFHFVQLRYRLLALEGGHLSEPSIPSCPESSTKWEAEESECKAIEHMGAVPPKSDTSSPAASYPSVPCPKKIDEPSHPSSSKSVLHANATRISSRPTRGSKDFHSSAHPGNHSGRPSARTFGSHKRKPASSSTSSSSSLSSCSSLSSKPESSVARVSLKESNRFPAGEKRTKTVGSRVPRVRDEVRSTVHLQSSKPNLNASNRSPKPSNRDGSVPKRLSAPSKKYIPSHLSSTSSSSDLETDGSNHPIPPRSAPKTLSKNSQKLDRSSHTKAPRSLNSGSHSLNGTSKASSSAYRLSDTSRHPLPPKSCDRVRIPEENDKKPQSKDGRRDGDLQSKQHDKPCRPPNSMRTLAPLPNAMMQSRRAPPSAHVSSKRRAPPGKTAPKLPPDLKNPLCGHSGPRNACSSPVRSGHLSKASSSSRTTASAAANRPTKIETDRKPQPSRLSDSSSLSSDSAAEADKHSAHSSISSSSSVSSVSTTSSSSECTLCSSPPSSSGPPPTKVKNFRKPPR